MIDRLFLPPTASNCPFELLHAITWLDRFKLMETALSITELETVDLCVPFILYNIGNNDRGQTFLSAENKWDKYSGTNTFAI